MGFIKTNRAESVNVVSDKENAQIKSVLAKTGKSSASQLTDQEKRDLPKQ